MLTLAVRTGLALAVLGMAHRAGAQQVIESDTKVTGPRGRSVERDVLHPEGAGLRRSRHHREAARRDLRARHPGLSRRRGRRRPRFIPGPGPGRGPVPRGYGGPREVIVKRNVFIAPPPPPPPPVGLFGFGFGGPSFNFGFNRGRPRW